MTGDGVETRLYREQLEVLRSLMVEVGEGGSRSRMVEDGDGGSWSSGRIEISFLDQIPGGDI